MTDAEETELEFDWGGDGSDRHKTVRAHVEAALVPSGDAYPPPLDQLLTLGNALEVADADERIAQIGFSQSQTPKADTVPGLELPNFPKLTLHNTGRADKTA